MVTRSLESLGIVHTEASHGWGGQEIRILTESAGMISRGHQVRLLCPPEARIFEEAGRYGVPAQALPIGRKNLRGFLALRRWLATHEVDVINTHSSTDSWLAALSLKTLGRTTPIVRTRHISSPIPNNLATRWLYQSATSYIVTTGERLREQLIYDNGYDAARIVSVPTGINTKKFISGDKTAARIQLGLPTNARIIGIVATLRSWKGHRYLIDAVAGLPEDVLLLIVGDGPQREALRRQIDNHGLSERVLMPGNQSDAVPWLQALDVFALPSYANEGVPQALIQAMLCGLPVVTTDVGGITEAVQHEKTGLIIPPQNVDALRGALARLLDDSGLRKQFGQSALDVAQRKFDVEFMLERMEAVFRKVIEHR
ncbi:MAG: glycosyltransferase family 4 protein [Burkholderiales bacterium]